MGQQEQALFEAWCESAGLQQAKGILAVRLAWYEGRAPLLAEIAKLRSDDRTIGFARWRSDGDGGRDLELCGIDDRGAFPIYADEFL